MTSLAVAVFSTIRNNPPVLALLLASLSAYYVLKYRRSPWRSVPPGPTGWPLIGNALELTDSMSWLKLTKWREVYGKSLSKVYESRNRH